MPGRQDGEIPWGQLAQAALKARERAYAPYSRFAVGAAVWASPISGGAPRLFAGCNVENASYGATLCAERVAVGSAVAAGFRRLHALVVAAAGPDFPYPCGVCRQVLVEMAPDLPIWLVNPQGDGMETSLRDLLPHPFVRFVPQAAMPGSPGTPSRTASGTQPARRPEAQAAGEPGRGRDEG